MAHPQSNGQVERANGMVLQGIKTRVFDRLKPYAGKWAKELPSVLWALRTSPSRATGESPFFLTYGSEVVLPIELKTTNWKIWTNSRKPGTLPQSSRPYISRAYVAITIAMYEAALSPLGIWSSERSKSVNTNSLQHWRALTSSLR